MYQAMIEHVKTTFNGGVIKPAITIFRQRKNGEHDLRVWNPLFLMHAGYSYEVAPDEDNIGEEPEVKKIGDQINLDFTRVRIYSIVFSQYRDCLIASDSFINHSYFMNYSFVNDLGGKESTQIMTSYRLYFQMMVSLSIMSIRKKFLSQQSVMSESFIPGSLNLTFLQRFEL